MFYQNMPLYLQLLDLLKTEYSYVHNLDKEYKYTLGEDIIKITWRLIDLFIEAQTNNQDKRLIIREIAQQFDCLKLRIRFLTELKQLSLQQTTIVNGQWVNIGKMIGSWQKNV